MSACPGRDRTAANAFFDVLQTQDMLAGNAGKGEVGLDPRIGARATLGRNACHFPPESWLRWLDHHRRARAVIAGATNPFNLKKKANEAIALNAFGEHYLQDSFAAGHLINKGFVMAEAMQHLSDTAKRNQGLQQQHIDAFREATAHRAAYDLPQSADDRAREERAGAPVTARPALDDPAITTARDPQTALERGRAGVAQGAIFAKAEEVRGIGLNAGDVTFAQYRYWLNDLWLQKITNTLHDKFCVEGLTVSSPAHPILFKIYGDGHMLGSKLGTEETALASRMSHDAINAEVTNKRHALLPGHQDRIPVHSEAAIMSHFPDHVLVARTPIPLRDWATGQHMRKLIRKLVQGAMSVSEGKVTGLARAGSGATGVSPHLEAQHTPF